MPTLRSLTLSLFTLCLLCASAAAQAQTASHHAAATSPAPVRLAPVDKSERARLIQKSQVWRAIDAASLDLFRGPTDTSSIPLDEASASGKPLDCEYIPWGPQNPKTDNSKTPKFNCRLANGEKIKVKYDLRNREVFSEIIGTRLAWATGFLADAVYAVSLNCKNCPRDPWAAKDGETGAGQLYQLAAVEREVPGKSIRIGEEGGFDFKEVDKISEAEGGAPRAHVDALKLLATLVYYNDAKPDNQRILCPPDAITPDGRCSQPYMMLDDMGATFLGSGGFLGGSGKKASLKGWAKRSVFKDRACTGNVPGDSNSTLRSPRISEAGRAFLAQRLTELRKNRLADIFRAAHVQEVPGESNTPEAWAAALEEKIDEIVNTRCSQR
jgi:hypothetical protein